MRKILLAFVVLGVSGATMADVPDKVRQEIAQRVGDLMQGPLKETGNRAEAAFKELDLAETLLVRDLLLAEKQSPRQETALGGLIQHWARLNGPAAYEFARIQEAIPRTSAESNALIGWASVDPTKAWDQLMVISNRGADRRYALAEVLYAIAETDLSRALFLYEDLLPDRACLRCCAGNLMGAASQDGAFAKVLGAISRMAPGPARDALRDEYWTYMGRFLPEWGLRNLQGMADPEAAQAAELSFCSGWALVGFDDCMAHILNRAPSARRDELILAAVQSWARASAVHEDVVKLVKTLPADLSERSLLGLASTLASVDPRATLDWVRSFPASEMRTQGLSRAIFRWARIDHDAARDYVRACEDTETRGIMLWDYLLAKLGNQTLEFAELREIDSRYNQPWRIRLFERISVNLADPSINNGGKYDLKAYAEMVAARKDFSAEEKAKILLPLKHK